VQVTDRAEALLRAIISKEQWEDFRRYGSVRIKGASGAMYEIGSGRGGWSGMVYKLDEHGEPIAKLCVHPSWRFPDADRIAALILAISADEEKVLRMANPNAFHEHEKERVKQRRIWKPRLVA
jgi:hypothetical protein